MPLENESSPRWMPVIDLVQPGSIGYSLVLEIPTLAERARPATIFNQSIRSLWHARASTAQRLIYSGINTVGDILKMDEIVSPKVEPRIREYLEGLTTLPHIRIIGDLIDSAQPPAPVDRELEIREAFDQPLKSLHERYQIVLDRYYGLTDGIQHTLVYIGQSLEPTYPALSRERVRVLKAKALRMLRHPSRSRHVLPYEALPEKSLGREMFGAFYRLELPAFDELLRIDDLEFSTSTQDELENKLPTYLFSTFLHYGLTKLVTFNLSGIDLSDKAKGEIFQQLNKSLQLSQEQKYKVSLVRMERDRKKRTILYDMLQFRVGFEEVKEVSEEIRFLFSDKVVYTNVLDLCRRVILGTLKATEAIYGGPPTDPVELKKLLRQTNIGDASDLEVDKQRLRNFPDFFDVQS